MNNTSKRSLGLWGLIATAIYLLLLLGGLGLAFHFKYLVLQPMELNQVGDFLAGAFGPLAIFWVVFGFFQQGEELRLQVRELALSVKQQKELVAVSKSTLDYERNLGAEQIELEKINLLPKFLVVAGVCEDNGREGVYRIELTVIQQIALDFRFWLRADDAEVVSSSSKKLLSTGDKIESNFYEGAYKKIEPRATFELHCSYRTINYLAAETIIEIVAPIEDFRGSFGYRHIHTEYV